MKSYLKLLQKPSYNIILAMFKSKKIFLVLIIIALLAIVSAGYFYYQLTLAKQNPQVVAQEEVADLISKVSVLVALPENEVPTVATVSDPAALKDQAFFTLAQKGDKVLIYAQAKKAILYSVTMNKILEIAPLNIGDKDTAPAKATTVTKTTPSSTTTSTSTKETKSINKI
jgi:hypothetical protein